MFLTHIFESSFPTSLICWSQQHTLGYEPSAYHGVLHLLKLREKNRAGEKFLRHNKVVFRLHRIFSLIFIGEKKGKSLGCAEWKVSKKISSHLLSFKTFSYHKNFELLSSLLFSLRLYSSLSKQQQQQHQQHLNFHSQKSVLFYSYI